MLVWIPAWVRSLAAAGLVVIAESAARLACRVKATRILPNVCLCVCLCMCMCVLYGMVGITVIPQPRQDRDPEPKTREPVEQLRWDWAAICLSELCSAERRTPTNPYKPYTHTHTHTHIKHNPLTHLADGWAFVEKHVESIHHFPHLHNWSTFCFCHKISLTLWMDEWENEWINLTEWNHGPCFCLDDGNLWQSTGNVKHLPKAIFIHTKKKKMGLLGRGMGTGRSCAP